MRFWLRALLGAIIVIGIAVAGLLYVYWDQAVPIAAMVINYVRYWSAPAGTLETEIAPTGAAARPSAPTASAAPQAASGGTEGDWPSYNKTLTSDRFSQLSQINRTNADKLKVLCTYDTTAIYRLQFRAARGERRADLRDRIRHLLDRSFDMPRELAHA